MKPLKGILSELKLYVGNHIVGSIPSHRIRVAYYRRIMGFEIGPHSSIHLGAFFHCSRGLEMGANSVINGQCLIDPRGGIVLGDNVAISMRCSILTADHNVRSERFEGRGRKVVLEDCVFVGTGATIMPGVTLGYAAVVAAGSVVTRDVESFAVVAGIPAKRIGTRAQPLPDYSCRYDRLLH